MGAREIQKCRISASVTSFSWLTGTDRCFWDKKLSFLNLAEIPLKMKKNIYFFVSYWFSLNLGKNSRENLVCGGFFNLPVWASLCICCQDVAGGGAQKGGVEPHIHGHLNILGEPIFLLFCPVCQIVYFSSLL